MVHLTIPVMESHNIVIVITAHWSIGRPVTIKVKEQLDLSGHYPGQMARLASDVLKCVLSSMFSGQAHAGFACQCMGMMQHTALSQTHGSFLEGPICGRIFPDPSLAMQLCRALSYYGCPVKPPFLEFCLI